MTFSRALEMAYDGFISVMNWIFANFYLPGEVMAAIIAFGFPHLLYENAEFLDFIRFSFSWMLWLRIFWIIFRKIKPKKPKYPAYR